MSALTNIGALSARYYAGLTVTKSQKNMRMLSSGLRVNSAAEDAAGLAVASKMKSQIRGLHAAFKNTSDGMSLLQAAQEGMQNSMEMVQRLRELAVQSHNGTYSDKDRVNLQYEADSLLSQLQKNADNTKFNGLNLLDGTYDSYMRVGNADAETVNITIDGIGVQTSIKGDSFASGSAVKILSATTQASGTSVVDFPEASIGVTMASQPLFTASTTASGISLAGETSIAAILTSSNPAYPVSVQAAGSTSDDIPATTQASGAFSAIYPNPAIGDVTQASRFTGQGFQNGNFSADGFTQRSTTEGEIISLTGWDIHLERVELDGDPYQIGGHAVPIDNDMPARATERTYVNHVPAYQQHLTLEALLQNTARGTRWDVQNGELSMLQGNNLRGFPYSVARGPYVASAQPETLEAGDIISFEWFGHGGGDVFDVYGYLVNEADGSFVDLLNATGPQRIGVSTLDLLNEGHAWLNDYQISSDGWITASGTIPEDGQKEFELKIIYHHSDGAPQYTDFMKFVVINDKRDDNNLALEGLNIRTREGAFEACLLLDKAVQHLSAAQAKIGALEQRLSFNLQSVSKLMLHYNTAHGRIMDTDFANASGMVAKQNILMQASTDMLVKANDNQRLVLELLEVM